MSNPHDKFFPAVEPDDNGPLAYICVILWSVGLLLLIAYTL